MTPTRAAVYIGVASVLVAWIASASVARHDAAWPAAAVVPVPTAGTDTLADDMRQQTTRLAQRLAAAPAPRESPRNPFAFAPPPVPAGRRPTASAPAPAAMVAPAIPEPRLELIGIAERSTPDGVVRTALVLADGETLLMVTVGDTLGPRFRVETVTPDAVQLTDLVRGGSRRLTLR